MLKMLGAASAAHLVGTFLADKFVIKESASDTGFVDFDPSSFGMDDIAEALTVGAAFLLLRKVF